MGERGEGKKNIGRPKPADEERVTRKRSGEALNTFVRIALDRISCSLGERTCFAYTVSHVDLTDFHCGNAIILFHKINYNFIIYHLVIYFTI